MTDFKDKLSTTNANGGLTKGTKIGIKKPLWQRAAEADKKQAVEKTISDLMSDTKDNRIALMIDCSGSMGDYVTANKNKMDLTKEAYGEFIKQVDVSNTAVAVETFPTSGETTRIKLTCDITTLTKGADILDIRGCTPMAQAMKHTIENYSLTRSILISDGQPDSVQDAYNQARNFKEADVPIDCVHIGKGEAGEECLKTIAEITGGLYIKFKDVESFAKSFAFLVPKFRGMLTSGQVSAKEIGADEVKFLGSGGGVK